MHHHVDTVLAHVLAIAREEPDRIFAKIIRVGHEPLALSYGELLAESSRYASLYVERGLRPKDVLVLMLGHGPELLYGYIGALRAGVVPSILAPISGKTLRDHHLPALKATISGSGTPWMLTDESVLAEIELGPRNGIIVLRTKEAERHPTHFEPEYEASPEDIVLLQHSSGTTGLKKGVALSNRAVVEQLRNYADAIALDESDRIVSWLPLYHDMGLITSLILPLTCRVPVVLMSPFEWVTDPALLLTAISEERGTLCWLPNFAYNFLAKRVDERRITSIDLRSMRAFVNCSEPVREESHAMFLERFGRLGLSPAALTTCYAMAENTFAVTQGGIHEEVQIREVEGRKFVSSGRPLANTRVRIVDEHRRDIPDGSVGEIAIQSVSLLSEYYRRTDLSAAAIADGWYFTGDLGFMMDGHLFVTGRKKDIIICAGKNIDPGDVEEIVSSIEGVHPGRVVAFGVESGEKGTQDLVIMAETKIEDTRVHGRIRLEIAKSIRVIFGVVVGHVEIVPHMSLIKSSSGKIARSANRARFLSSHSDVEQKGAELR